MDTRGPISSSLAASSSVAGAAASLFMGSDSKQEAVKLKHTKVKISEYATIFSHQFNEILTRYSVEPTYNPLHDFGKNTDKGEDPWKKFKACLFNKANAYALSSNQAVENALRTNRYKMLIDKFLKAYFLKKLKEDNIDTAPELIIRSIRSLIFNIEYLITDPIKKKTHLEATRAICLGVIEQANEWASDRSLFSSIFNQRGNDQLLFAFTDLLADLSNMLTADITKLAKRLETTKLPDSLNTLKSVLDSISVSFPMTLLLRLLDRPIPENMLSDRTLINIFSNNEDITFDDLKKSNITEDIKHAILNPSNQADDTTFRLIRDCFLAYRRAKLRRDLATVAVEEALSYAQKLASRITGSSPLPRLTSPVATEANDDEEEKTPALQQASSQSSALVLQPSPGNQPQTSMMSAIVSSTGVNTRSLSKATQQIARNYHEALKQDLTCDDLVACALPKILQDVYHNKQNNYKPALVAKVKKYVKTFIEGFYLIEQLNHLSENVAHGLEFMPQGGNLLGKQVLPLRQLLDAFYTAFTQLKTITDTQESLSSSLRNDLPELHGTRNFYFHHNSNLAMVLSQSIDSEINEEGIKGLHEMESTLRIESLREDAKNALKSAISMIALQAGLQGISIKTSPMHSILSHTVALIMAQSEQHATEMKEAGRRYEHFVDGLTIGHQPLALLAPVEKDPNEEDEFKESGAQIEVFDVLSLAHILEANLAKHKITLGEILAGEISEEQGQFYLKIKDRTLSLEAEAKEWILMRKRGGMSLNINIANPMAHSETKPTNLLAEQKSMLETQAAIQDLKKSIEGELDLTLKMLPHYNRHQDFTARLIKWWVPLTIIGITLFIAAKLYRLIFHTSINKDLAIYKELSENEEAKRTQLQQVEDQLKRITTSLSSIAEQIKATPPLLPQAEQKSHQQRKHSVPVATSSSGRLLQAPAALFSPNKSPSAADQPNNSVEQSKEEMKVDNLSSDQILAYALKILKNEMLTVELVNKIFSDTVYSGFNLLKEILDQEITEENVRTNPRALELVYKQLIERLINRSELFNNWATALVESAKKAWPQDQLKKFTGTELVTALPALLRDIPQAKNEHIQRLLVTEAVRRITTPPPKPNAATSKPRTSSTLRP